ncbi:hypothetical protein [Enterococcus faecium]|uniref:hypothetical protein n=1 Tax=Enterococcus faecium TaxID=1352 RepID=UPI000BF111B7|nr:hypothetical protein [Enterococcus faecium]PEH49503.1 hypothetical protein CRM75_01690 [Enterococcus faecium]
MKKKQVKLTLETILKQLEEIENGILLIPDSAIAIVDERDLEVFDIPEMLEDAKTICFWLTDGLRNYFSVTDDKILWIDNSLNETATATVFKGNVKEEIEILINNETFEPKILSDNIIKYEDPYFYQEKVMGQDLDF